MKEIPLTQGKFALVDDQDFEYLNQWKWHFCSSGYALRRLYENGKSRKFIRMHRVIAGTPEGMETDHVNHNKLDNRRDNLRICTHSQNQQNRISNKHTSIYKGVFWHKIANKWAARIEHNKQTIHIGVFNTQEEAANAYDQKAKELRGDFAMTNFHCAPSRAQENQGITMSTDALCKLAAALQMFLAEKEYESRTQERIAALEQAGLNFSPDELK